MIENLINSGINKELIVIIIAALPVIELRGALPVAINVFHIPWYWAFLLAVIGNMLPVPILLLFFDSLAKLVSRVDIGRRFVNWGLERTRRHGKLIEKYEHIGLMLFVAIPLPLTGAWTGSIAAFLMGMKFKYSILSIFCGVIIAGAIVTSLCLLGWIGAVIAGVALSAIAVFGWWRA
jgi:uncharacterized membrane protein